MGCASLSSVNGWQELIRGQDEKPRPTVLLDATAGVDPRYLLVADNIDEIFPAASLPNTTIVLNSNTTVSRRAFRQSLKRNAAATAEQIAANVEPYRAQMTRIAVTSVDRKPIRRRHDGKLLIITDKKSSKALRSEIKGLKQSGRLPRATRVVHFGSLSRPQRL